VESPYSGRQGHRDAGDEVASFLDPAVGCWFRVDAARWRFAHLSMVDVVKRIGAG
jgi:hypothetical protein